ncbi:MAG: outer membrane beta-barrel family protein [Ignavibacteriaceae bacterium]
MKRYFLLTLLTFSITAILYSQQNQQPAGGIIRGKVIDTDAKEPIEYANIILYSANDSMQVTGTITNTEGIFQITPVRPGNYYVDVQFISYEKRRFNDVILAPGNMTVDLGTIEIHSSAINLGNVVVEGERSPVSYQIDKKVIDVNQMATSMSGNAADVLSNVPSVTVDIEGNVSLRGSDNFTVLVDGRPSVLDAQDVLQQIPASSIDNIEIITNPSAKYDPEGSAGIVNIITKKTKTVGISGITNLNAGLKDKYGGDLLFEYKTENISTNFGIDYNNRNFPGSNKTEIQTAFGGTNTFVNTEGTGAWGRESFGLRGGIDFYLGSSDVLSLGGRFGDREMKRTNNLGYIEWTDINPEQLYYRSHTENNRGGYFYALNLNHQHKFAEQGHQVLSEISFRHNKSDETNITELFNNNVLYEGIKNTENGPSSDIEGKIDYTLPIGTGKFEAGYKTEFDLSTEELGYYEFNPSANIYEYRPQFSNEIEFDEREQSFYSTYSNEIGSFGFQGGLRAEYTYRSIQVADNPEFLIDEWDFFPGIHTSYTIAQGHEVMASYTRRIQRPGGWQVEPFDTWMNATNIRRGNPALKPQYIDSYEAGFRTFLAGVSFTAEGYYRISHNKIEHLQSAYSENVRLNTFDNVGTDYSLGTELMFNFGLGKIWDANLMGNLYNYKIEGTLFEESFSRESFNWNTRFNNIIKLTTGTQFQVNLMYNSPTVSSQGEREGFFSTDLAVKQELLNRALSVTLQIRDIFSTARMEFTSSGPDFYSHSRMERDSPMVMLNVRYNINHFKQEDRRRPENGGDFEGEGEF